MSENAKTKRMNRKSWPDSCVWPEPLTEFFGLDWDEDDAAMETDEDVQALLEIKAYFDGLREKGYLDEDYRLDPYSEDLEDDFEPEMGEDYWSEDDFELDLWQTALNEAMNDLKISGDGAGMYPVDEVAHAIGYTFENEHLLRQAFTRRAFQIEYRLSGCSEELEFLGDVVLAESVTRQMMEVYTELNKGNRQAPFCSRYKEGELSRIRESFINKDYLSKRCQALALDRLILYGTGETVTASAMEDAMEALVGALYLDCGKDREIIDTVVDKMLHLQLSRPSHLIKTSFYEEFNAWHQRRMGYFPEYHLYKNKDQYECMLTFEIPENDQHLAIMQVQKGWGSTRSEAREIAAEFACRFLRLHGLWIRLEDAHLIPDPENSINQLQELYQKKYVEAPVYELKEENDGWLCDCYCDAFSGWGRARTKVKAKKKAAYQVLVDLLEGAGLCRKEWKYLVYEQMMQ